MIIESTNKKNIGTKENPVMKEVKITEVALHCFTLTINKEKKQFDYAYEDAQTIDFNDGKRHRVRGHRIAEDDVIFPELIEQLTNPTMADHSGITNAKQYGEKLGNFCPLCLKDTIMESKRKFPNVAAIQSLKE